MKAISAILLVAGRSSRMQQLKGLLPWKGHPLIESQIIEILASLVCELIVVLGYKAEAFLPYTHKHRVQTVFNRHYEKGKTSSIIKGLKAISPMSKAVFIISVDQPVSHKTLNRMIDHLEKTNKQIVIPVFNGKRGHPPLFSTKLMDELLMVSEQTEGLRHIIRTHGEKVTEISIADRTVSYNLNRPTDYDKAIRDSSEVTCE